MSTYYLCLSFQPHLTVFIGIWSLLSCQGECCFMQLQKELVSGLDFVKLFIYGSAIHFCS